MSRRSPSFSRAFCGADLGTASGMGQFCLHHFARVRPALKAMRQYTLGEFDFALPPDLIAQHPAAERSGSRLLDGTGDEAVDRTFRDLPSLLQRGAMLVLNDTQVVKARLFGEKPTGGKLDLQNEHKNNPHKNNTHMKVSKKPQPRTVLR